MTLESTHIAIIKIKHPKSTIKSNTKMILVSRSQVSESLQLINCLIRVDGPWLWLGLLSWFGSKLIEVSPGNQRKYQHC